MQSHQDGSQSKIISSASLDLRKRWLPRPVTRRFLLHVVVSRLTLQSSQRFCALTMPHTSSDKLWLPTEERLPSCLWFRTSGESPPIHLAKGISQEYRCRNACCKNLSRR